MKVALIWKDKVHIKQVRKHDFGMLANLVLKLPFWKSVLCVGTQQSMFPLKAWGTLRKELVSLASPSVCAKGHKEG